MGHSQLLPTSVNAFRPDEHVLYNPYTRGFSFHNLQALMGKRDDSIDSRNQEFETRLTKVCSDPELSEAERATRLSDWESAPHARYCHPREEHLLPLQVCYGIGQQAAATVFQEMDAGFITSTYRWI